ncbi:MAG TPA: addiction module protein [Sedimentisphaerales bacterium]|nr:addiction module protein [Sedimentisphaerales bacterium]
MSDTIEIAHLSREEKLRVMEAIWEDLSRDAEQVDSPDWHREALEETGHRLGAGRESLVDWQDAKKKLRKRFE